MQKLRALTASLLLFVPLASVADPALTPAHMRSVLATGTSLKSPTVAALHAHYFEPLCWKPDGLPFDALCNHVPPEREDDPSPWPDAFIGLRDGRIVAVLADSAAWVPRDWHCSGLPGFDQLRMCTPRETPRPTHREWARRWATLLSSAG